MKASLRYVSVSASIVLIVICLLFLIIIDRKATAMRYMPAGRNMTVVRVGSQADVYRVFQAAGLWGAHVVHFGQHFYLMPYFPHERSNPVPFPIETYDVRPLYEQGIDSHSWLFIANKTGLVRKVTAVIPDAAFREKVNALESDFSFRPHRGGYRGYSYDMPREVFSISDFICPAGPVVVNVDATVFVDGVKPEKLYAALQQRCSDIRMFLLVDSKDDTAVTDEMREALGTFQELVKSRGI
jgi:hypothetical protein